MVHRNLAPVRLVRGPRGLCHCQNLKRSRPWSVLGTTARFSGSLTRIKQWDLLSGQLSPSATLRRLSTGSASGSNGSSRLIDDPNHSFKVTKISFKDGSTETVNLQTNELLRSANIFARDLFTLNLTSRQERGRAHQGRPIRRTMAAIDPRTTLILVSFGNVRAVVDLEHAFLLDAHLPTVQDFAKHLAEIYRRGKFQDPYELIFLEFLLRDTIESFHRRFRLYEPIVDSFLDKVANEVYSDTGVHMLVPIKDALQNFEIQIKQSLDCLTELLNNDDEMLELLLTEQAVARESHVPVDFSRHEHVELLLGVYARQLSNLLMEVHYLLNRVQSKQEFVALALAGYRNRLVRMNVHIGIAGLSIGLGTTVAGFFGMNLINGLEQSQHAFTYVILGSGFTSFVLAASSLSYLSGRSMQHRAAQRLDEIEALTSALSDMCALDYAIKNTVEKDIAVDRDEFCELLKKARLSKTATKREVDVLFDAFDRVQDGFLTADDFDETKVAEFQRIKGA